MAYAALILFKQALEKILPPRQEIQALELKVSSLLGFLEDVSLQKYRLMNISDIEGKIRDAAYEGRDIIETYLSRNIIQSYLSRKSNSSFAGMSRIPTLDLEIKDLQKVIKDFDFILESVLKINDGEVIESLQPESNKSLTAVVGPSRIAPTAMVGLEGDYLKIKDRLTGWSSRLEIISIIGMGGIGKTTLATNLYNDSLIDYHFDIRSWVTVSQDYRSQEVLWDLQRHFHSESHSHNMSIDQLEENLYKSLKGRRYLIVMDDVWDTKVWNDVKRFFPDDSNGSRIILTTRISEVSLYAGSSDCIHRMSLLSLDKSWDLLRSKVFREEISCPPEFEEIGKMIAGTCKGLPLAIVAIGGLICRGSRTLDYWEYIARNVMSAVTRNDDQLMDILSLSYNYLPHHLKACFLYMGAFPEDKQILVSKLIKLWVAEGFLKPHHTKIPEEMAGEYLNDLIDRNLIMVGKRDNLGEIKSCFIHDLLRDLSMKKAQEERFLLVLDRNNGVLPKAGYSDYRISIHSHVLLMGKHHSDLRSFLHFAQDLEYHPLFSFMRFRLLKVLDSSAIMFYDFPNEIVELVNLRYIALCKRSTRMLPTTIIKLKNLQTLLLYQGMYGICPESWCLPSEIWEMQQLRHLCFKRGILPYPYGAQSDGIMVNLYTLCGVENFICRKEVFEIMPNLKKLEISYVFNRSTEVSSFDFTSFVYLPKLETLKLSFNLDGHWQYATINFGFPPQLRYLTLSGCRFSRNKMTIIGLLPNLEALKLKNSFFEDLLWEPNEGEFVGLKVLLLDDVDLESWNANAIHFPKLEHLSLRGCLRLEEIPCGIGDIPTLEMIEACYCSKSVEESAKIIKEEQWSLGNESLQVCVI